MVLTLALCFGALTLMVAPVKAASKAPVLPQSCLLIDLDEESVEGFVLPDGSGCPLDTSHAVTMYADQVIVDCGRLWFCGRDYSLLVNATGQKMYTSRRGFSPVQEPWEHRDVPVAWNVESGPAGSGADCIKAIVDAGAGTDLFVTDDSDLELASVESLVSLAKGQEMLTCARYGGLLQVHLADYVGLVKKEHVVLRPMGVAASYLENSETFCSTVQWKARASRLTFLYVEHQGGFERAAGVIPEGTPMVVVGVVRGRQRQGRAWYVVQVANKEGLVPPDALSFDQGYERRLPSVPRTGCPSVEAVAQLEGCSVKAVPLDWLAPERKGQPLPAEITLAPPMSVPVVNLGSDNIEVLVLDTIAAVSTSECMQVRKERRNHLAFSVQGVLERMVRPLDVAPGMKPQLQERLFARLTDRTPGLLPEPSCDTVKTILAHVQAGGGDDSLLESHAELFPSPFNLTAGDLRLLEAAKVSFRLVRAAILGVAGYRGVAEAVRHALEQLRSCGVQRFEGSDALVALVRALAKDKQRPESVRQAACKLVHGKAVAALRRVAECLSGQCRNLHERLLAAAALQSLRFHFLARDEFLAVAAGAGSDERLLAASVFGYRGCAGKAGHGSETVEKMRAVCEGSTLNSRQLADACFVAAQAAHQMGNQAVSESCSQKLETSGTRAPRHLAFLGHRQALAGLHEDAVGRYAQAIESAGEGCGASSELVQKLVLQMLRTAYVGSEFELVSLILDYLSPEALQHDYRLALEVLVHNGRFDKASLLKQCMEQSLNDGGPFVPELHLAAAYVEKTHCRFEQAEEELRKVEAKVSRLRKLADGLDQVCRSDAYAREMRPDRLLEAVDGILLSEGVSSQDVPELDAVLSPHGACGRWWEVKTEKERFARLLSRLAVAPDAGMAVTLEGMVEDAGLGCVLEIRSVPRRLRERADSLAWLELRQDNASEVEDEIQRAYSMLEMMARQGQANFCDDLERWAAGLYPSWLETVAGVLLPFEPGCPRALKEVLSDEQREQFHKAVKRSDVGDVLAELGRVRNEDVGLNPAEALVDPWVRTRLAFLERARKGGARVDGLMLLVRRYLPSLKFVTHELLAERGGTGLPRPVLLVLQSYAEIRKKMGDFRCLPTVRSGQ